MATTSRTISVLDHGYVTLVDALGDDDRVVDAARVSYAYKARRQRDLSDEKLLRYMMKNKHTSPFEHVVMTFEVQAPIFVLRQWHRHRTWSYNEVSARYTELPEVFYVPQPEHIGRQSETNKQGRELTSTAIPGSLENSIIELFTCGHASAYANYTTLLDAGVPRELARAVLPVAIYSRMYATVDLHNLFGFLRLRLHPHAQYEIRVYAIALLTLARTVAPLCVSLWEEFNQSETPETLEPTNQS